MKETQFVQNNNFGFAALQLRKYMQKSGKFARVKEKLYFLADFEIKKKKDKKRRRKYIEFYNNNRFQQSGVGHKSSKYVIAKS